MDATNFLLEVGRIKEIPTLPLIVHELNKQLKDPATSIAKVSETIEKDQALSSNILKLVNSAFYGFKTRISDIRNAVVLLGYNAVRNAIVSISVIKAFSGNSALKGFDVTEFWKHSLAVAVTSKNISMATKINSPDNCFVGGLLHDIGKVILAQYFKDMFSEVWNTSRRRDITFWAAEQDIVPADHAKIGAFLAARWKLPKGLVYAIRRHHAYQTNVENEEFIRIIYLANAIVNSYADDRECQFDTSTMPPEVMRFMMQTMQNVGDWYSGISAEIEAAYDFFLSPADDRSA